MRGCMVSFSQTHTPRLTPHKRLLAWETQYDPSDSAALRGRGHGGLPLPKNTGVSCSKYLAPVVEVCKGHNSTLYCARYSTWNVFEIARGHHSTKYLDVDGGQLDHNQQNIEKLYTKREGVVFNNPLFDSTE